MKESLIKYDIRDFVPVITEQYVIPTIAQQVRKRHKERTLLRHYLRLHQTIEKPEEISLSQKKRREILDEIKRHSRAILDLSIFKTQTDRSA